MHDSCSAGREHNPPIRSAIKRLASLFALLLAAGAALSCTHDGGTAMPAPSTPKVYAHDARLREITIDLMRGMDGPDLRLTPQELSGRMVWNLWSGDNAGFWNYLAQHGFGTSDLLKTIDSRRRAERFAKIGIINQPGFQSAAAPDRYGLFIDTPRPGDADGAIDTKVDLYTYGRSSGVIGLRLFDNPDFTAAAQAAWMQHIAADGVNHDYYENPRYYNDRNLVRPYRVGMACAFCHVSLDPVRPPADPAEPEWANLNDYAGAQYFRVAEVFGNGMGEDSFVWQILHSNQPGTLDTSFIATDYLNNPGTMNAIFNVPQRVRRAEPERVTGGALALRGVTDPMATPRVLKEGADSVGFTAALSRVYVNIGEDWQDWTSHFNPLIGGTKQTPISVDKAQRESAAWNWSEERAPALAAYFVKVARPLLLKDAPGGAAYLTSNAQVLNRGRIVFAENCAGCHSSKQPPAGIDVRSDPGRAWFRDQAQHDPAFFTDNFLGDERRHPVDVVGTNAARAAATNAIRGHIWDNFSSETYKTLPAVKPLTLTDAFDGAPFAFALPAGGPGYYRPPSLIGLWATAPFFHNNALGTFNGDPSVAGRMAAFDDAVHKLLWPERRPGRIWRTTAKSYITVPASYIPAPLRDPALLDADGNLRIGPIPKNTPVNLLANTNLEANVLDLGALLIDTAKALIEIDRRRMTDAQATAQLRTLVPRLMKVNKCPDFVEDRGHLFGTKLPDGDKEALIALLKTF
jgi:hypothetical protein